MEFTLGETSIAPPVVWVDHFDGSKVWIDSSTPIYEVGNFLGGGAAGTVYEAVNLQSKRHFALKILNPLGYKLTSPSLLRRCTVIWKGSNYTEQQEAEKQKLLKENVWWLVNSATKQYLAAYHCERQGVLKEISLVQCSQIWGLEHPSLGENDGSEAPEPIETVAKADGTKLYVPAFPPKFIDYVRRRARIFREIQNMRKICNHVNVIKFECVLELTQESKNTLFLVMELANGGELFDRIKIDSGTREDTAQKYFQQLLEGVQH